MLESVRLENVGPASTLAMEVAPRLNLLTGNNGLGKSFLLDVAWWALTQSWPAEVNPSASSGLMARPARSGRASIDFTLRTQGKRRTYQSEIERRSEAWIGKSERPVSSGIVLYAQVDGGFSVWDSFRHGRKQTRGLQRYRPACVFSPNDVWSGLKLNESQVCNGLIADWASWQKEGGEAFRQLANVLSTLSLSPEEQLVPGDLTRLSIDDARWIPTLRMPHGTDVPVLSASAAMKRMVALAYLLVWSWREHLEAAAHLAQKPASHVTLLIDEVESHLHPRWQRTIARSLLQVMEKLAGKSSVQVIATTQSPLILASVEPFFDPAKDAWLHLDLEQQQVVLQKRSFVRLGDVSNWLTSEAFGLLMPCSIEAEAAMGRALELLARPDRPSMEDVRDVDESLRAVLSDVDRFWVRWSAFVEHYAEARREDL